MNIEKKRERIYKRYDAALSADHYAKANDLLNQLQKLFASIEEYKKYLSDRIPTTYIVK